MDPNTVLHEIRAALKAADNSTSLAAKNLQYEEVATRFQSLDAWLSEGGSLPREWTDEQAQPRVGHFASRRTL
jgi:hypothetical protein